MHKECNNNSNRGRGNYAGRQSFHGADDKSSEFTTSSWVSTSKTFRHGLQAFAQILFVNPTHLASLSRKNSDNMRAARNGRKKQTLYNQLSVIRDSLLYIHRSTYQRHRQHHMTSRPQSNDPEVGFPRQSMRWWVHWETKTTISLIISTCLKLFYMLIKSALLYAIYSSFL